MPRLNSQGHATTHLGQAWFTDELTIEQKGSDAAGWSLALSDGTIVAPRGANELVASGNGHWAAWLAGYGVFDSFGNHFPSSGLGPMGPSGAYLRRLDRNGGPWVVQTGAKSDLLGLDEIGNASWSHDGNLVTNGQFWEINCRGHRFYQLPDDRLCVDNRVILPAGNYFYLDVRWMGFYRLCWSPNQADTNAQFLNVTEEELKLLPEVLTGPPAPTPPSVPPPIVVNPPKEVPSVSVPNQLSTVEQIRAKYPTPLGVRHPEFLVEVASATGGKLLRKDSGTHVTLASGDNVSQDIIVYGSTGVDILQDGEGAAKPTWIVKEGETFDATRLVSVAVVGDIHPVPIPGLPGPEVDMSKVSQAISEALAPLDERLNVIGLKVSEVAAQLEALLKTPAKAPKTIKVQSSRAFGHSHSVEFVV